MGDLITATVIDTMSPCEFEDFRECGEDCRQAMSFAVLKALDVPNDWGITCECQNEYGGFYPIQCKFSPPNEGYHISLCSPGAVSLMWQVILLSNKGEFIRVISVHKKFDPERVGMILEIAAIMHQEQVPPLDMATYLANCELV